MPDATDALARRAYEAFYDTLGTAYAAWGWAHLRPQVQQAWRRVVEVVREGDGGETREEDAQ